MPKGQAYETEEYTSVETVCQKEPDWCNSKPELLQQDWDSLCYTAALRWIMAANDPDWVVVHGTVLSDKVGKRIDHAWCERGKVVVDLVQPIGSKRVARKLYYQAFKPEVNSVYPAVDAMFLAMKEKQHGPWHVD